MFCSTCGFDQTGRESNYCSGCGRSMTGKDNSALQFHFGHQPVYHNQVPMVSMRKNGLKLGGKMIMGGLILVPLLGILSEIFRLNPVFAGLAALICFWGGFLRMIYAAIFEGNETESLEQKVLRFFKKHIKRQKTPAALPQESVNYANVSYSKHGMWRENPESGSGNGSGNRW